MVSLQSGEVAIEVLTLVRGKHRDVRVPHFLQDELMQLVVVAEPAWTGAARHEEGVLGGVEPRLSNLLEHVARGDDGRQALAPERVAPSELQALFVGDRQHLRLHPARAKRRGEGVRVLAHVRNPDRAVGAVRRGD